MTINIKRQFFWGKIQKSLLLALLVIQFIACAKSEPLKTESFKTAFGWGYTITYKNKIIIKQSIIPAISAAKSFSTERDALKVGNLVVNKLNKNISPTVTKNDLILLKIKL